jgi:2-phospho-L-lactate guanylyltransferase (CobY/MobA/RfbA family)
MSFKDKLKTFKIEVMCSDKSTEEAMAKKVYKELVEDTPTKIVQVISNEKEHEEVTKTLTEEPTLCFSPRVGTYTMSVHKEPPKSRLSMVFEKEDKKELNRMLMEIGREREDLFIHPHAIMAAVKLLHKKIMEGK